MTVPQQPDPGGSPPPGVATVALVAGGGALLLLVVVVAVGSAGDDLGRGRSVVVGQGLAGFLVGAFGLLLAVGIYLWVQRLRGGALGVTHQPRRRAPGGCGPWWPSPSCA